MIEAKAIKVFNMDNGNEIELLDINPTGVCLDGIVAKVMQNFTTRDLIGVFYALR
jgi:hypothetical protein